MFICQFGMHNHVQGYRNANVCKQTYDASCRDGAFSHLAPVPVNTELSVVTVAGKALLDLAKHQNLQNDIHNFVLFCCVVLCCEIRVCS